MWKVKLEQKYVYKFNDGKESEGVDHMEFIFRNYTAAMNFIELAVEKGAMETKAIIEFVPQEGEENGQS